MRGIGYINTARYAEFQGSLKSHDGFMHWQLE
jgi:hypothetical protein